MSLASEAGTTRTELGLESTDLWMGPTSDFPLPFPFPLRSFRRAAQDLNLDRLFKPMVGQLWTASTSSGTQ